MSDAQKYYYAKPKSFSDRMLGRGFWGSIAQAFFTSGALAIVAITGIAVGAAVSGAFTFTPLGLAVLLGFSCGTMVTGLAVGRLSNILDDRNKLNRFNKYKKLAKEDHAQALKSLAINSPQEELEYIASKKKETQHNIDLIDQYFADREYAKKIAEEKARQAELAEKSWLSRVNNVHANIEATEELEAVSRA